MDASSDLPRAPGFRGMFAGNVLSDGRFVLGAASGDRPVEFPAYGRSFEQRGALFREALAYLRDVLEQTFPTIESPFGVLRGADLIPKPRHGRHALVELLELLEDIGVNHVAFNLKYGRGPAAEVVDELGREVVPRFAPALVG